MTSATAFEEPQDESKRYEIDDAELEQDEEEEAEPEEEEEVEEEVEEEEEIEEEEELEELEEEEEGVDETTEEGATDGMAPEKVAMLKQAFDCFSKGQGFIKPSNVGAILQIMEVEYNASSLKDLIAEIDGDGSGHIEFPEFICLFRKFEEEGDMEGLEKELKQAFRLYDKEGTGLIPTTTLRLILSEIDTELDDECLDGIVREVDADGSGSMDFQEFFHMMTG